MHDKMSFLDVLEWRNGQNVDPEELYNFVVDNF